MDPDNPVAEVNGAPAAPPQPAPKKRRGIAPIWHTVLLAILLIVVSAAGANGQHAYTEHRGRIALYTRTMIAEWLMAAYVIWGVRKRGVTLRELTGGRWSQPEDVLLDVGIAAAFWFVAIGVLVTLALIFGLATGAVGGPGAGQAAKLAERCSELKRTVGFIAPATRNEILAFLGLSLTAGFCEELVFRGYFQRQFAAWSGFAFVGLLGQAVLFGASHGYEGTSRMLLIGVYALLFGTLAWWRKSLRPGMMAHAVHDGIVGVLIRPVMRIMGCG